MKDFEKEIRKADANAGIKAECAPDKGPVGIWGWNTIPILNLVVLVLAAVLNALFIPLFIGDPEVGRIDMMESVINFGEGLAAIPVLIWAFRRDTRYPKTCGWLFAACAIFDVVLIGVCRFADVKPPAGSARSFIFAIIWIQYFKKSVRIRNTYGTASVSFPIRRLNENPI